MDRSNALHLKSGCMAAIFTYSQNHQMKAWQKWASMYGRYVAMNIDEHQAVYNPAASR